MKTAVAAAVGIVAVATAPLATAVVGTGLAVYGTVSNYRQRAAAQVAAGQKVNKVGTFFAALGDTLGVSGLIEGITGKRMLTGQKLSSAQAGEKLGGGVASVAAMVAGLALVKTIRPVVAKVVEPIKSAVSSFLSRTASAVKSVVSPTPSGQASGGWLQYHEAQGGHTLARHVGKSDIELVQRLSNEPNITGSSSFTNQRVAEQVISETVSGNRATVQQWLRSDPGKAKLSLSHDGTETIGRGVFRGSTVAQDMTNARVVLRRNNGFGYHVHTAFPTE